MWKKFFVVAQVQQSPRIIEHDKHISEAVAAALPVDCLIFESEVTLPVALLIACNGERWFV
jgi:hypothetical protein